MSDDTMRLGDDFQGPGGQAGVTRLEEEALVRTEVHEAGKVRVRKYLESETVEHVVPRRSERADLGEHVPAVEGDSGEIEVLEDGSVSIPIFEEELVVTKRFVVRERLIVRKVTEIDEHRLQTELRKERVEVQTEGDVDVASPRDADPGQPLPSARRDRPAGGVATRGDVTRP